MVVETETDRDQTKVIEILTRLSQYSASANMNMTLMTLIPIPEKFHPIKLWREGIWNMMGNYRGSLTVIEHLGLVILHLIRLFMGFSTF